MRTKNPKQKKKVKEQEQLSQVGNKNRTEKSEHKSPELEKERI